MGVKFHLGLYVDFSVLVLFEHVTFTLVDEVSLFPELSSFDESTNLIIYLRSLVSLSLDSSLAHRLVAANAVASGRPLLL